MNSPSSSTGLLLVFAEGGISLHWAAEEGVLSKILLWGVEGSSMMAGEWPWPAQSNIEHENLGRFACVSSYLVVCEGEGIEQG